MLITVYMVITVRQAVLPVLLVEVPGVEGLGKTTFPLALDA